MRTTKGILIFLMLAVLILGTIPSAMAGRGDKSIGQGESPFVLDPKAPGDTFDFTLALLYENVGCDCNCPEDPEKGEMLPDTNMTFFMRLETNKAWYSFGDVAQHVCYWDFAAQQAAIEGYIKDTVIPDLADQGIVNNECACFAIKEVSNLVENVGANFLYDTPVFTLMDMVIAIDRNTTCPPCPPDPLSDTIED